MNALASSYECVPRLGESLRNNREKWRQITDCKVWFTTLQLSIATVLRGANLSLELFAYGAMGASAAAGAVTAALDAQETHYYYQGSGNYAGTEKNCQTCAGIMCLITVATFCAGVGAIIASVFCWLLSYLFIFLSFLWCFRTDLEFEATTCQKIDQLTNEIQKTEASAPEYDDENYKVAFEREKEAKLTKLKEKLKTLTEKVENERAKREQRSGKSSPTRPKNVRSVGIEPVSVGAENV